jgi:outer membrane protein
MSKTRQAQDNFLAASDQMITIHRQVIFDTQQAFNNVMAGISKVHADRIAITSAQSALDSIQAGYQAGTKTILDVLTAQQNLYQAESTLSTDQNSYILSTFALKQSAGSLNAADILSVNRWLAHG